MSCNTLSVIHVHCRHMTEVWRIYISTAVWSLLFSAEGGGLCLPQFRAPEAAGAVCLLASPSLSPASLVCV